MRNSENPCFQCTMRTAECHSHCDLYAAYRAKCDAVLDAQQETRDMNDYYAQRNRRRYFKYRNDSKI